MSFDLRALLDQFGITPRGSGHDRYGLTASQRSGVTRRASDITQYPKGADRRASDIPGGYSHSRRASDNPGTCRYLARSTRMLYRGVSEVS